MFPLTRMRAYRIYPPPRCSDLQKFHQLLSGITQVIVGGAPQPPFAPMSAHLTTHRDGVPGTPPPALQIFRVYAMYHSSRKMLYTLLLLAVGAIAACGVRMDAFADS